MTDEEIASKYANEHKTVYGSDEYAYITDYINIKQAFLAGLKAGKPKWHDLREDPKDLPKDNDEKLCFYGEGKVVARYDSKYGCWETRFNNLETVIPSSVILAWCETSVFGQE